MFGIDPANMAKKIAQSNPALKAAIRLGVPGADNVNNAIEKAAKIAGDVQANLGNAALARAANAKEKLAKIQTTVENKVAEVAEVTEAAAAAAT